MKLFKRLSAMTLSLLMVLLMMPTVALADTVASTAQPAVTDKTITTGSLTITKVGSASEFAVYKLFDMSVASGEDIYTYTANSDFAGFFTKAGAPTTKEIAAYDAVALKTFTGNLQSYISTKGIQPNQAVTASTTETKPDDSTAYTAKFEGLTLGYYLVVETKTTGARVASDDFLVSIPTVATVGGEASWKYDVTANCKDSPVTFDKTIVENNTDVDSVTQQIGKKVDYRLDADVPKYDRNATNITFEITDNMSKGLTYDNDVTVHSVDNAGNTSIDAIDSSFYTVTPTSSTTMAGGTKIAIVFNYDKIKDFSKIKVFYTATLNSDAVIGKEGNPNEAYLTYTNNPDTKTTHDTDKPKTYVYTFGIAIEKVDAANTATKLPNAEFALLDSTKQNTLAVYTYDSTGKVVVISSANTSVLTDSTGMATFLGMKEGTYYIRELTAPSGYSVLPGDVEVVITAVKNSETPPQPTGDFTCQYKLNGAANYTNTDYTYSDASDNTLKILAKFQIADDKGFTLPGTGGIGTTIFTVSGIAIILLGGCLAFVYNKKRKKSAQH